MLYETIAVNCDSPNQKKVQNIPITAKMSIKLNNFAHVKHLLRIVDIASSNQFQRIDY